MPFLHVDGFGTVPVSTSGAARREGVRIGGSARAFSGALRSTVRGRKREWQFATGPLGPLTAEALRSAVEGGGFVDCSGDAILPAGGPAVPCEVTVTGSEYVENGPDGFAEVLTLVIAEA